MILTPDLQRMTSGEKLLWDYGVLTPDDIDLEAIAFDKGIIVRRRPLKGADARLVGHDGRAIVTVSSDTSIERQRFSIGHELGHWLQDSFQDGLKSCSKSDISPRNQAEQGVEEDANRFSSDLLLPKYIVVPLVETRDASIDLAFEIGKIFRTSVSASLIKLMQLSESPALVVWHDMKGRKGFLRNLQWPTELWPISEVHYETEAIEILFKGKPGDHTKGKPAKANQWLEGRNAAQNNIWVQSMKLPNNQLISIIRFLCSNLSQRVLQKVALK